AGGRGNRLLHVGRAECVAQHEVRGLDAALPAGLLLFHAAERLLVSKARVHERARQIRREVPGKVPAQVGAPVGERGGGDQAVGRLEEARLADVDRPGGGRAHVTQERRPGERWGKRVRGGERQLVVVG